MMNFNELYHYGMPRRSGRYPWGSGERPYQGDIKKSIDDAVKKDIKVRKEQNKFLASEKIAYQMKYKIDNQDFKESVNRLSKKSKIINDEVNEVKSILFKEMKQASKSPEFKKEVYDKASKDLSDDDFYFKLEDAIRDVASSSRYIPEFSKKRLKLDRDIDDYEKSWIKEVDNLVGGDVGKMPIPKMKSGVTYGDVLEKALNYNNKHSWNLRILEEMEEGVIDILLSYMDEDNQK